MYYTPQNALFSLLDATSSNITSWNSQPCYVGDYYTLSLSIQTGSNTSASLFTVLGSNQDGLQSAASAPQLLTVPWGTWSVVTTIAAQGIYTISPGFRWLTVARPNFAISGSSCATVTLQGTVMI